MSYRRMGSGVKDLLWALYLLTYSLVKETGRRSAPLGNEPPANLEWRHAHEIKGLHCQSPAIVLPRKEGDKGQCNKGKSFDRPQK